MQIHTTSLSELDYFVCISKRINIEAPFTSMVVQGGPQSTVIVICPFSQAWVKQSGSYLVRLKFRLVDLITCIKHNDWSSYDSGSDVWRWGKFKNVFFCCRLSLTEYFSIALCEWPFLLTSDKAWDVSSPLGSSMQSVLYQEMTLMQPEGSCVSSDNFQKGVAADSGSLSGTLQWSRKTAFSKQS